MGFSVAGFAFLDALPLVRLSGSSRADAEVGAFFALGIVVGLRCCGLLSV